MDFVFRKRRDTNRVTQLSCALRGYRYPTDKLPWPKEYVEPKIHTYDLRNFTHFVMFTCQASLLEQELKTLEAHTMDVDVVFPIVNIFWDEFSVMFVSHYVAPQTDNAQEYAISISTRFPNESVQEEWQDYKRFIPFQTHF